MNNGIIEQMQAEIIELKAKVAKLEERNNGRTINITAPTISLGKSIEESSARIAESMRNLLTPPTPQAQRDQIVEQAKRDVAELLITERFLSVPTLEGGRMSFYPKGCEPRYVPCDKVDFVINSDKRTVVALIKWIDDGNVWGKGIAKCAPTDCFNAHIGKAIALRRALGLEVPAEYLNAPQPTDVRVGDVVKGKLTGCIAYVDKVDGDWAFGKYADGDEFFATDDQFRIIDDTREGADAK